MGGKSELGTWDSPRILVATTVLFTMALLVVGTGIARLTDDLGLDPADATESVTAAPDIETDIETDIGEAVVEHNGPLRVAPTDHLTIVRVSASTCGERRSGSGVVVADGLVLTAAHVVGDAGLVRIDTDMVTVTAEVVGVAMDGRDLALIAVEVPMPRPIALGSAPRLGDPVTIVGYPEGAWRVDSVGPRVEVVPGVAAAMRGEVISVDTSVALGVSGGPALAGDGGLVGIVVGAETISGTALVVAVDDLGPLIEERMVPGECPTSA